MNPSHDTDEEIESLLRRMFEEIPASPAPAGLARRARRLAAAHAAGELARVERLRVWAFGLTAGGLIAIAALTLQIAARGFDLPAVLSGGTSNLSTGPSSGYQLLVVTVVAGVVSAIGALLVVPALSSGDD